MLHDDEAHLFSHESLLCDSVEAAVGALLEVKEGEAEREPVARAPTVAEGQARGTECVEHGAETLTQARLEVGLELAAVL